PRCNARLRLRRADRTMKCPLVIVGAGGHATVVADALLASGAEVLGFLDADTALHGRTLCGLPVLGSDNWLVEQTATTLRLVNGLGGVGTIATAGSRRRLQQRLTE